MIGYETEVHVHGEIRGFPQFNQFPETLTDWEWFAEATADTGTNHLKIGRPYVVMCEWTGKLFIAPSHDEAMRMFREHEERMFTLANEWREKRKSEQGGSKES